MGTAAASSQGQRRRTRTLEAGKPARLSAFRETIAAARREVRRLDLKAKPNGDAKAALLRNCRNHFPDEALGWLDAVVVLGHEGARFPPRWEPVGMTGGWSSPITSCSASPK